MTACVVAIGVGKNALLVAGYISQAFIRAGREEVLLRASTNFYPVNVPEFCFVLHILSGLTIPDRWGCMPPFAPG
ncbi:hypothetical protein DSLASN_01800 [Desulfoluna limicola]|uniref:Uncharacterized protein n=1 Tax=Desulfoluna limicola TaxID=2810562 RepID=A0ABN6EY22_9BACT|nr:hypothetical protein DSLASN_01800 [Desulfoluna limicola]